MCNHYLTESPGEIDAFMRKFYEETDVHFQTLIPQAWPKYAMPVIYQAEKRTRTTMRWGVWPHYEPTMPSRVVTNARDDGLLTKSIWKQSAAKRRCLVPADGFFEPAGPEGAKWEALFHLPDRRPFFFAGLWSPDPGGDGRAFALVTGKPNAVVAALPHDRMPVILEPVAAMEWIGQEPLSNDRLLGLCQPYAGELIRQDMPPPPPRRKIAKADLATMTEPAAKQGELF